MNLVSDKFFPIAVLLLILWIIPWKGVALWEAARKNDKWWFIALLLINTVGLLDILYIFFFSKENNKKT